MARSLFSSWRPLAALLALAAGLALADGPGAAAAAPVKAKTRPAPNPLDGIQHRITWRTTAAELQALVAELQALRTPAASSYLNYWQAYAYYHLYFRVHASQPAQAESYLQSGIAALEAVAAPSSEHLALLSLLQGLNLEYSTFVLLPVRAGIAQRNAEKALALHARNLRACYALAIHDYYTPKIYGGGQLAQRYFRRAVALPDKSDRNPYAPDWGKADAYWYLARTFAAAGQPDSVRHYAQQGALRYPWHQGLVNLAKKP